MSGEFKVLLHSVENPDSPHLIRELAQGLSIDEDTSQSIVGHTPIILLDNLDLLVAAGAKNKFKKLLALGANLVITDEALEETPRVNWPEDEMPEIASIDPSLLGLPVPTAPAPTGQSQPIQDLPIQKGALACPSCGMAFRLQPVSPSKIKTRETGPKKKLPAPEKADPEVDLAPLAQEPLAVESNFLGSGSEESTLSIGGLEISEEKVLPGESSEIGLSMEFQDDFQSAEPLSVERDAGQDEGQNEFEQNEFPPASALEESAIELEPEEGIIEFHSEDMDHVESFDEMNPSDDDLVNDDLDEPMELGDDDMSTNMDLTPLSMPEDPPLTPATSLAAMAGAVAQNGLQDELQEESEVDLEALAPSADWDEENLDSEDLSVLDSDDGFSAIGDTSSDEFLLEEMLPLYEASSESLAPEEALRLLQESKSTKDQPILNGDDGDDLETLDPQEALDLLKQATSSRTKTVPEKAPKFQKLQTKKKTTPVATGKITDGTGPHGVVLSRILADEKKVAAAKMISEIKKIPINEAKQMTNKMIIPVLRGVSKEVADEISTRFKSAGISVRVTTRKQ